MAARGCCHDCVVISACKLAEKYPPASSSNFKSANQPVHRFHLALINRDAGINGGLLIGLPLI